MPFTTQQIAIHEWVKNGEGNGLGVARAGAGKTTTAIGAIRLMRGSMAVTSYSAEITAEIADKVAAAGLPADVKTAHGFGFRAWRMANPAVRLDKTGKIAGILEALDVPKHMRGFVTQAVSLGKQRAIGIVTKMADPAAWMYLVDHHKIDACLTDEVLKEAADERPRETIIREGLNAACRALRKSIEMANEVIDFDDQIYMPLYARARIRQYDWLVVDEAQDTNPIRRLLYRAMVKRTGRVLFIGNNCQPLGTPVTIPGGATVAIEDLKVGDMVVSYRPGDSAFLQQGRRVNGITRRPYEGDLVVVRTPAGHESRYTPNHHCYANFSPLRGKFAVYMMRRGEQFRIGKCKMDYVTGSGLSMRMHQEKADEAWILTVYDTEDEAFFMEQAIAGRYRLPQLCFNAENMQRGPAAEYNDRAWQFIGENFDRANACLASFGRDIWHPLFRRGTGKQQTIKRPMVVRACNLIEGALMLPYRGMAPARLTDWQPITITREHYCGDVVSLDVDDTHLYVADGLVTHNCQAIYGFTGADNDALEIIRRDFTCTVFPLTVSFRCPVSVIREAQRYVPDIESAPGAKEGRVRRIHERDFGTEALRPGLDAVVCRNTKPLVDLFYSLLKRGIPAHVEGKDEAKTLTRLAFRWKRIESLAALADRLVEFRETETASLIAKGRGAAADAMADRVDTLLAVIDGMAPDAVLADLKARLETMFIDSEGKRLPAVALMTAHRSKGREFERVFLWGANALMPSRRAESVWEMEQEMNLLYVAITRAMDELVYVDIERSKKEQERHGRGSGSFVTFAEGHAIAA